MNVTRIADRFFVSPQISPEDMLLLKEQGYRSVVNNRPDGEEPGQPTAEQLRVAAEDNGLLYSHIPIVPGTMTDDDARALTQAVERADGPVLAFCRTGNRSANLWKLSQELAGPRR